MSEQAQATAEAPTQQHDDKEKIPGLEITYGDARSLEWTQEYVTVLQQAKQQFQNVHAINIADSWFIIRSLNRREYRNLVQEQAGTLSKEVEAAQEAGNADGVRATLNMMSEDAVAVQGTIYPNFDKDSLRNQPSGVSTTLHDSILQISGYQNQPVPIKV